MPHQDASRYCSCLGSSFRAPNCEVPLDTPFSGQPCDAHKTAIALPLDVCIPEFGGKTIVNFQVSQVGSGPGFIAYLFTSRLALESFRQCGSFSSDAVLGQQECTGVIHFEAPSFKSHNNLVLEPVLNVAGPPNSIVTFGLHRDCRHPKSAKSVAVVRLFFGCILTLLSAAFLAFLFLHHRKRLYFEIMLPAALLMLYSIVLLIFWIAFLLESKASLTHENLSYLIHLRSVTYFAEKFGVLIILLVFGTVLYPWVIALVPGREKPIKIVAIVGSALIVILGVLLMYYSPVAFFWVIHVIIS